MLSPWDAYRWFETPVERTVTLPNTGAFVLVAPHNVRRVALVLGLNSSTAVLFSTAGVTGANGIYLAAGSAPWVLTQQQHGALCQVDWYAGGPGALSCTVIEVLLRDWPHTMEGPPDGA